MRVPVGEVSYKTQRCAGHKVNKSAPFFRRAGPFKRDGPCDLYAHTPTPDMPTRHAWE